MRGEHLVVREDLLDENDRLSRWAFKGDRQALEIAARVAEPVHVVDSDPGDASVSADLAYEPVGQLEHGRVLDPDADEAVDVEEPAVVDLMGAQAPVRGPVVLLVDDRSCAECRPRC